MYRKIVRLGRKGQISLPQRLRELWGISENSKLLIIFDEDHAIIRPIKKLSVEEGAGILGPPSEDEVEYAALDPELIPLYFEEKYRRKKSGKIRNSRNTQSSCVEWKRVK